MTVATCVALVVITAVAWAQVVSSAMTPDPMQGMFMAPTVFDGLVYVASWTVMMAAMMLPSALPMIGLYAATQRNAGGPARKILPVALFTLVYLGVWAATGVPMYFASTLLAASDTVDAQVRHRRGARRRRDLPESRRSSRCASGTAAARSDSSLATGARAGAAVSRWAGRMRSIASGAAGR